MTEEQRKVLDEIRAGMVDEKKNSLKLKIISLCLLIASLVAIVWSYPNIEIAVTACVGILIGIMLLLVS